MFNKDPQVIFETSKLRCVLAGRTHQTANKVYHIEEKNKDAMQVETWTKLDQITVCRNDTYGDNVGPERRLLIALLEEKERV